MSNFFSVTLPPCYFPYSRGEYISSCSELTPDVRERMTHTWMKNNPVSFEELRYLTVSFWGFDRMVHSGELIVHHDVAEDLIAIFGELFEVHYPIEKMHLIDAYQADDELSMVDNNSSAFCSRMMTGSKNRFSDHSYGRAIDINPFQNPYVRGEVVLPQGSDIYLDREKYHPAMIKEGDPCHRAFRSKGWLWGGDWRALCDASPDKKDYHHFFKPVKKKVVYFSSDRYSS